jgi:K+-transporting ATPase KdpF subunit
MSAANAISLVVALVLSAYLIVALLRGERF